MCCFLDGCLFSEPHLHVFGAATNSYLSADQTSHTVRTSGLPATWRRDMTAIVFTRFSTASFISHSSFFEHTKRQWSAAVLWWYAVLYPQCSTVSSTSACSSHGTPSESHCEAFSIQSSHISKERSSVCRFPGFAYLSLCNEWRWAKCIGEMERYWQAKQKYWHTNCPNLSQRHLVHHKCLSRDRNRTFAVTGRRLIA